MFRVHAGVWSQDELRGVLAPCTPASSQLCSLLGFVSPAKSPWEPQGMSSIQAPGCGGHGADRLGSKHPGEGHMPTVAPASQLLASSSKGLIRV